MKQKDPPWRSFQYDIAVENISYFQVRISPFHYFLSPTTVSVHQLQILSLTRKKYFSIFLFIASRLLAFGSVRVFFHTIIVLE